MNFYILFDVCMVILIFIMGYYFYKSNGKGAGFLSGYNRKTDEERKKYDEKEMCRAYGKRMMVMSLPFLAGAVIDTRFNGIGCLIAWCIWAVMFILLLADRHKRER